MLPSVETVATLQAETPGFRHVAADGQTIRAALLAGARSDGDGGAHDHVLFMCPHGAGKSVLASAYFERLAREKGLKVRVDAAAPDLIPRSARRSPST